MWFHSFVILAFLYSSGDRTSPEKERFTWCLQENPGYWDGIQDEKLLKLIKKSPIKSIRYNKGGSTISLRLIFNDGSMAAFKPDQIHKYSTIPRYEIAAYRLNRLLGLSRVPPATWRIISKKELIRLFDPKDKKFLPKVLREITWRKNNTVAGEVSYWIPVIKYLPLDQSQWRTKWYWWLHPYSRPSKEDNDLTCQISKMILFDFLINNPDRFSGYNTMTNTGFYRLFFMDNTMSFGLSKKGHPVVQRYMSRVRKFSKTLVNKLMDLTYNDIANALEPEKDAPWPILTRKEIKALLKRRDKLLEHIVKTVAQYGWDKTMVYP